MHIKIPHFPKAEDARPLESCIEYACARTGVDHYTAVLFMTHFLDQLADEVTRGRTVSIPGFGMFAPYLRKPLGKDNVMVPRFSPSRGFREQVKWGSVPKLDGTRKFKNHQKNNAPASQSRRGSMRVFTAMEAIRQAISAQMGHARD